MVAAEFGFKVAVVNDSEGELTRAEALDRIRKIRGELRRVNPEPKVVDATSGPLEPDSSNRDDAPLQALQLKYEMELAAHRDTTMALLAEKDRTIARLEQQVAELRLRVERVENR